MNRSARSMDGIAAGKWREYRSVRSRVLPVARDRITATGKPSGISILSGPAGKTHFPSYRTISLPSIDFFTSIRSASPAAPTMMREPMMKIV